jgi:hypothetical protein
MRDTSQTCDRATMCFDALYDLLNQLLRTFQPHAASRSLTFGNRDDSRRCRGLTQPWAYTPALSSP